MSVSTTTPAITTPATNIVWLTEDKHSSSQDSAAGTGDGCSGVTGGSEVLWCVVMGVGRTAVASAGLATALPSAVVPGEADQLAGGKMLPCPRGLAAMLPTV